MFVNARVSLNRGHTEKKHSDYWDKKESSREDKAYKANFHGVQSDFLDDDSPPQDFERDERIRELERENKAYKAMFYGAREHERQEQPYKSLGEDEQLDNQFIPPVQAHQ